MESTKQKSIILTKQIAPSCYKSNQEEDAYVQDDDSSEEEKSVSEHIVSTKPHPSINYTKPDLCDRWKKAGKEAAEHNVLCGELQKQLKNLNRRIAFI